MTEETMADVDHTHPQTDEPFGSVCAFERGPQVATDGGTDPDPEPVDGPEDAPVEDQTMAEVDHTPPTDDTEVNRVFERGTEGRDEGV